MLFSVLGCVLRSLIGELILYPPCEVVPYSLQAELFTHLSPLILLSYRTYHIVLWFSFPGVTHPVWFEIQVVNNSHLCSFYIPRSTHSQPLEKYVPNQSLNDPEVFCAKRSVILKCKCTWMIMPDPSLMARGWTLYSDVLMFKSHLRNCRQAIFNSVPEFLYLQMGQYVPYNIGTAYVRIWMCKLHRS